MVALRAAQVMAGAMLLLALTACGSGEHAVMPDVVGNQLDVAKSDIKRAGYSGDVEVLGGGLLGVLDDTNWLVCEQEPAAGAAVSEPRLLIDRECGSTESMQQSPESADPSAAPTLPSVVTDTTVDELLDRLNGDLSLIEPGEQFRFTGELFLSDMWFTGATGDYVVNFKAKGGANDLMVLLDEVDTLGWTDGTQVEMVVENVEISLQGDTSDGWLRMVSATTLP